MLANQNLVIFSDALLLVPYRPEHVERYHAWMQSEELRELTASEPLSLKEEYEMQEKWRVDEDKLTFIIHERSTTLDLEKMSAPLILEEPMIGDVNLFLKGEVEDEEFELEVEIMIAEPRYRRKGYATMALQILLSYATAVDHESSPVSAYLQRPLPLPRNALVVRIGANNMPSIAMFKKLGFVTVKHIEVFNEIEMRMAPDPPNWIEGECRRVEFS